MSRRFLNACLLASCALPLTMGCSGPSTNPDGGDAGRDTGGRDVFEVIYYGPGNLSVDWTVNGMTGQAACDAVHATQVELQVNFGGTQMLPCTGGPARFENLPAGNYSVDGKLRDAMGNIIYRHVYAAVVNGDQTTDVTIPFSPPGSIAVSWTVGDMPAAAGCMTAMGEAIELYVQVGDPPRATLLRPDYIVCRAGAYRFDDIQTGTMTISGQMYLADPDHPGSYRPGQMLTRVTTVVANEPAVVEFPFLSMMGGR